MHSTRCAFKSRLSFIKTTDFLLMLYLIQGEELVKLTKEYLLIILKLTLIFRVTLCYEGTRAVTRSRDLFGRRISVCS